ncbi:MAG: DUF6787 family protein [Flavobacteriales bacterium]
MSWLEKLKTRWGLSSIGQVIIVLVVFACTGTTVVLIKKPLLEFLTGGDEMAWCMTLLYYLLVLPFYNLLLLTYGFIFGQFSFFWNYEKKFFQRIGRMIRSK